MIGRWTGNTSASLFFDLRPITIKQRYHKLSDPDQKELANIQDSAVSEVYFHDPVRI